MTHRIVSAPARPVRWLLVTTVAALACFAVSAVQAQAQAPAPAPAAPKEKKAKAAPKPAAPAPAPEAQAPMAPPQQGQPAGGPVQMPQFIYSPWVKLCGKGQEANAKQVCFTGKDARTEAGQPVIAAALIEPDGETKKLFRITLPSPLQLQYGTHVVIDQLEPLSAPFFTCFSNGCMVDYDATADLVGKLKKGQMLTIQAVNLRGDVISFPLPLVDFAKANEGPPTDPKVLQAQQEKLQSELQKKAEEARKKLEQQPGGAPAAPGAAPK